MHFGVAHLILPSLLHVVLAPTALAVRCAVVHYVAAVDCVVVLHVLPQDAEFQLWASQFVSSLVSVAAPFAEQHYVVAIPEFDIAFAVALLLVSALTARVLIGRHYDPCEWAFAP